jgi:hypothetical protein
MQQANGNCKLIGRSNEIFQDHSSDLMIGDARESDARNYITGIHRPVLRNPLGGPAEGPTPAGGVNDRITCIIEARNFDLAPFALRMASERALQSSVYVDESANFLDEGYIEGSEAQYV